MKKPLLTIGMPTYFDFSGTMFTVRALIEYHYSDEIEILVVDNTSDERRRKVLADEISKLSKYNVRYFEFMENTGPAEVKNKVMELGSGEYIMCVDSHVLLEAGVVQRLLKFLKELPEDRRDDLYSGPLKHSSGGFSTNFKEQWRGEMWGIWETREDILNSEEPVEAWANGCGLFLARKDSWLGFNPNFNGFGGEEGYIHEKYRKNGKKFYIIPWLNWWHRFNDPDAKRFNLSRYAKIRNYVLGFLELGKDTTEIYNHFVNTEIPEEELTDHLREEHSAPQSVLEASSDVKRNYHEKLKISKREWDWLMEDPVNRIQQQNGFILEIYDATLRDKNNDLAHHYGTIKNYALQSDTILNVSRRRNSSVALGAGMPKEMKSLTYSENPLKWYDPDRITFKYSEEVFDKFPIEELKNEKEYDLVFLKLPHEPDDLEEAVLVASRKARKFFILHDTAYGYKQGMSDALKKVVSEGWFPISHVNEMWGLTVFGRNPVDHDVFAWTESEGPGTELKKILESYGLQGGEGCGCNAMAQKMNNWGPEGCRKNMSEITAILERNANNWLKADRPNWWTLTKLGWNAVKDHINPLNPYESLVNLAISKHLQNTKEK
jgi:glycosyltransferase involved in cell wall biosynthesis